MKVFRYKYDKEYFTSPLYKQVSESQRNSLRLNTIRKLKNKGKLLDIGCGEGELLDLARKYYQTEGIDISDYAVHSAISKGHKARTADISETKLPEQSYDIISAFNILEHLKRPHYSVENIFQALKNDGVLIGSVPSNFGLIGGLSTWISNFFDRTHRFTPAPKIWYRIFQRSGFASIKFLGEVTLTKNDSWYLNFNGWHYFSFNLVFICHKA